MFQVSVYATQCLLVMLYFTNLVCIVGHLWVTANSSLSPCRKLLYEEFLDWVKDVTGVALTDTVDMTCSRYDYTGW